MTGEKYRSDIRVLIVAEHASLKFGGEAALPLMFFRLLRQRNIEAWLCVHERTRSELKEILPDRDFKRIHFVEDTIWHRQCHRLGTFLPKRLAYFTAGFVLRLLTQIVQRRIAKEIIKAQGIDIVHQPLPVSPKEPSLLFNLGAPVVIGPMNGGMHYPAAFQHKFSRFFTWLTPILHFCADLVNLIFPGKLKAEALIFANERTKMALPQNVTGQLFEIIENGIDFSIWDRDSLTKMQERDAMARAEKPIKFVFVGRLVKWKGVDLLLEAFSKIANSVPAELEIIGDGGQRQMLEEKAQLLASNLAASSSKSSIKFSGWLSQKDCARRMIDADIFVLPSIFECGGAVVLEAMAMKLPVIATKWGGPTDYINEECGILVEPSSRNEFIQGLADAMLDMARNPEKREQMGAAGYQRAIESFGWDLKIDNILDIYQTTIESTEHRVERADAKRQLIYHHSDEGKLTELKSPAI